MKDAFLCPKLFLCRTPPLLQVAARYSVELNVDRVGVVLLWSRLAHSLIGAVPPWTDLGRKSDGEHRSANAEGSNVTLARR